MPLGTSLNTRCLGFPPLLSWIYSTALSLISLLMAFENEKTLARAFSWLSLTPLLLSLIIIDSIDTSFTGCACWFYSWADYRLFYIINLSFMSTELNLLVWLSDACSQLFFLAPFKGLSFFLSIRANIDWPPFLSSNFSSLIRPGCCATLISSSSLSRPTWIFNDDFCSSFFERPMSNDS